MTVPPPMPEPEPRKRRDATLLWAAVVFTAMLICCVAAAAIFAAGGQIPRLGNGPSWTPPAASPTLAAQLETAPTPQRSEDLPFIAGDPVRNASGGNVNLRRTPGYLDKAADDVVAVVAGGETGAVTGPPALADGLRWWPVRFGDREGWMAERSSRGVTLLEPAP